DMRNFRIKDDIITLLIHIGYLGYDAKTKKAFIPNKEIILEFENAMSVGGWSEIMRVLKASDRLLEATLNGDEESVARGLDQAHTEVASILTYNDENSLGCAVGLAYYSARKDYRIVREMPTGRGFADLVFLPLPHTGKPAIVMELKYDKTAETAIRQIKEKHYTQALEDYTGEVILVGINYEKENKDKPHSCVIERIKKNG
ncbi:MAG: PD-(D/E)XK nuclease domain-containing protein, partial [Lachnospiraceae bacterium]|nr:PD-(D/E)XK nuclease domain-containing protein [Lachnospiraceae bacterium]